MEYVTIEDACIIVGKVVQSRRGQRKRGEPISKQALRQRINKAEVNTIQFGNNSLVTISDLATIWPAINRLDLAELDGEVVFVTLSHHE